MQFTLGLENEFQVLFKANKEKIRRFPGVEKLELYRDKNDGTVFFTYSVWKDSQSLDRYRRSELFKSIWLQTRSLFAEKAQAWSVDQLASL
ncbi:MAG: antibiotic biosynthesis monooxygenase family protein [Vicingaceae bacterium]